MMKNILHAPIFLYLLPVFFFLIGFKEFHAVLTLNKLVPFYILFYIIIFLIHWLVKKRSSIILIFYSLFVYLFFGNIKDSLDQIKVIHSYFFLVPVLLLIGFLLKLLLKKKNYTENLFLFSNRFMFFLCFIQILTTSISIFNDKKFKVDTITFHEISNSNKPSIHLIVFDGYPGFQSLQTYFKYNNEQLKSSLIKNNFLILDTIKSNYYQTYRSLNSILNLQYVPHLQELPMNKYIALFYEMKGVDENQLVTLLKSYGYSFINNSIFNIDHKLNLNHEAKFESPESYTLSTLFHRRLIKDNLWKLGIGKYKINYIYEHEYLKEYYHNMNNINRLLNDTFPNKHFTYTHLMMPHEPYFTDSTGKLYKDANTLTTENLYLDYLKFTNKKMIEIVTHLVATEPRSIIILMSDHGYREYTNEKDVVLKFDNFMAIRTPDSNYVAFSSLKSNVNVFRIILNQYFEQHLPLLKDSCFDIRENENKIFAYPIQ